MKTNLITPSSSAQSIGTHRSKYRAARAGFLLLAAATISFASTAHAVTYTFTNIADSSGIFARSGGASGVGIGSGNLSINNFGTVAFSSGLDDGGSGVFRGSGGAITTIALSSSPVFSLVAGASINDSGTVAFVGQLDAGGSGVFTGNGGPTMTVALSSETTFSSFGLPVVNSSGAVAFPANLDFGGAGIFRRSGATTNTIAIEGGGANFSGVGFGISISSAGTVALRGISNVSGDGIFAGSGGPLITITLGTFPTGVTPSINDLGTVAFASGVSANGFGTSIATGNGGPVSTYASDAGSFIVFGRHPVINDSGRVVFLSGLVDRVGLFTGPDAISDKVILTNEPLFGSVLTSLIPQDNDQFRNIDINNSGQIAFHYQLADGREGIAVATPVPEPASGALLIAATSLLLRAASRRQINQLL